MKLSVNFFPYFLSPQSFINVYLFYVFQINMWHKRPILFYNFYIWYNMICKQWVSCTCGLSTCPFTIAFLVNSYRFTHKQQKHGSTEETVQKTKVREKIVVSVRTKKAIPLTQQCEYFTFSHISIIYHSYYGNYNAS